MTQVEDVVHHAKAELNTVDVGWRANNFPRARIHWYQWSSIIGPCRKPPILFRDEVDHDPMLPSELWTPYWLVSSWCYNCIPVVNLPCLGASGSRWVENLGCWRMPRISSLIPCLHSNNVLLLGLRKGWQTWPEEWSCSYRISYRLLSLEYWSTHGQMTTFTSETGRIWKNLKMTNEIWCGSSYFYCKEYIFLKSFNLRTQCW